MTDTEQQHNQRQAEQDDSHGDQGRGDHRQHQRPGRDEPVMLKRGETGTVKWFSYKSGYGFIQIDNSEDEAFVHSSSIVTLRKVFCVLREGDQVEFDVIQGLKGLEAVAVTGVGGRKAGGTRPADRRPPAMPQQQGGEKNGGRGKGRRRNNSQENNNEKKENKQGEENGGNSDDGVRKQNGGRPQRRAPRGGDKQSPEGEN